jgi:hypothetical protein
MKTAKAKQGIGMVTSSGLPWVAKRILEAASWIKDGKDYAPATVVRMLRESRGNMQEFWYAWSELLEIAYDKFDWSQAVVLDRDDREKYASADDFYRREVEPFLGPLERLRTVAGLYRKGEITHDEGKRQLRKMQAEQARDEAETVVQGKHSSLQGNDEAKQGNGSSYLLRRLARLDGEWIDRYEAGEFASVRQAAIAAGIVKVPSVLDQLHKLWSKATPAERVQFLEDIKAQ